MILSIYVEAQRLKKIANVLWVAPLLFPNMWYCLQIIRQAYKWLFAWPLVFVAGVAVLWKLGEECLCLCALLRVTFFPLCHPTPISFQYIQWLLKSNEHFVYLYSLGLYKIEKLNFQYSLKIFVDTPPQNNQSMNET